MQAPLMHIFSLSCHLNRQNNLDAHVLSLMHKLAINQNLISTDSVAYSICGICNSRDLDLAPLTICRDELALRCALLELGVDALVFDAALALDKRRIWTVC